MYNKKWKFLNLINLFWSNFIWNYWNETESMERAAPYHAATSPPPPSALFLNKTHFITKKKIRKLIQSAVGSSSNRWTVNLLFLGIYHICCKPKCNFSSSSETVILPSVTFLVVAIYTVIAIHFYNSGWWLISLVFLCFPTRKVTSTSLWNILTLTFNVIHVINVITVTNVINVVNVVNVVNVNVNVNVVNVPRIGICLWKSFV